MYRKKKQHTVLERRIVRRAPRPVPERRVGLLDRLEPLVRRWRGALVRVEPQSEGSVGAFQISMGRHDGDRQPQRRRPPPSSKRKTLYDVLGVSIKAPRAEVKRAYRALALRLHPDKCASPTANERFNAVQEAYATLGDRSRRAAYDASL